MRSPYGSVLVGNRRWFQMRCQDLKDFRNTALFGSLLLLFKPNLPLIWGRAAVPFALPCSLSVASGVPALSRPSFIHVTSFIVVSSPTLDSNLSQGRCLSHIATEGFSLLLTL